MEVAREDFLMYRFNALFPVSILIEMEVAREAGMQGIITDQEIGFNPY